MAFVKNTIRIIWSTKNREPYLVKDIRPLIVSHSKDVYKHKGVALGCAILMFRKFKRMVMDRRDRFGLQGKVAEGFIEFFRIHAGRISHLSP